MNLIDLEIHAWIRRYVEGRATLDEFEDWFVPKTWDVERTGNVPAIEAATAVRAALADVSAAEIDESEFREQLQALEDQREERVRIFQASVSDQRETLSETIIIEDLVIA